MSPSIPDDILNEAALLHIRLGEDGSSQAQRTACDQWLEQSPVHRDAFQAVRDGLHEVDRHRDTPALAAMRAVIRARGGRFQSMGSRLGALAAVAATLVLGLLLFGQWHSIYQGPAQIVYRTGVGELRTVKLADGSLLSLDSGSAVGVSLGRSVRQLTLLDGQARFRVAHDTERPFLVQIGQRQVRATGTDFNIDYRAKRVTVTLISGRVRVSDVQPAGLLSRFGWSAEESQPIDLLPGQRLTGTGAEGRLALSKVDLLDVTAWQQRMMIVNGESLADVVKRINFYSGRKIILGDDRVARMQLSGAFSLSNPAAFTEAVEALLPIRVLSGPGDAVTLVSLPDESA